MNWNPSFTLLRSRSLPEIDGTLHELEHNATGAKLAWLQRPDDNKTFAIAFTTLPEDSTGVFHILEHSVLCGSDKYPVKEPFVELLKNSMNTFLNAMTFPDKTCYPVSSRNDKDFLNLVRVYLDAVFCPAIYRKPEIFCQEGWHYEFDENGNPSYKGVVFNEMKGAYASPEDVMGETMMAMLFPDNCYRFSSGGDPAVIPELTYEQFLDSHRRFYSPSNSFIFLDGDVDMETVLTILEEEYLSKFPRGTRIAPPAMQQPVLAQPRTVSYELGQEEDPESRWRWCWGNVIGDFADREKAAAMQILASVLCGGNQAPLTKAILEQGLAENVSMQVMDGMSQNFVQLDVENCREADLPRIEEIICAELARLAEEGLDREQLTAQMANLEFRMRERDYGGMPRGLIFGLNMMETWLYGGDPADNLQVGDLFEVLARKMEEGWFEELIRTVLLHNPHSAKLTLKPDQAEGERRRQAEQARLQKAAAGWSEGEKEELMALQQRIQAWQGSEDTPEQLATLPILDLADISAEPEELPIAVTNANDLPVLVHQISCGGIVYVNLYFDIDDLDEEAISRAGLLSALLGDLATGSSSAQTLMNRRKLLCGRLTALVAPFSPENTPDVCRRKLMVSYSALEHNLAAATELVLELLTDTRFEDESAVMEILRQAKTMTMQQIIMSGSTIAARRVEAQSAVSGVVGECSAGYRFYRWLKEEDEKADHQSLLSALSELLSRVFCRARLTVSVTGTMDTAVETVTGKLNAGLARGEVGEPVKIPVWGKQKEGIAIPADIAFAAKGGSLLENGGCHNGILPLAGRIISLGYLWNVIRVQGGAYGTGMRNQSVGVAVCSSYRDPSAARSLKMYDGAAEFLRSVSGGDLTGFIIGAVSDDSQLLTPRMMGTVADRYHFCGIDHARLRENRQALLNATADQLLQCADWIEKTIAEGGICVIGGQKQLEDCGLDTVLSL